MTKSQSIFKIPYKTKKGRFSLQTDIFIPISSIKIYNCYNKIHSVVFLTNPFAFIICFSNYPVTLHITKKKKNNNLHRSSLNAKKSMSINVNIYKEI